MLTTAAATLPYNEYDLQENCINLDLHQFRLVSYSHACCSLVKFQIGKLSCYAQSMAKIGVYVSFRLIQQSFVFQPFAYI